MEKPKFNGFIDNVFGNDKFSFYFDGAKLNLNLLKYDNLSLGVKKNAKFLLAKQTLGGTIGLYNNVCYNNTFNSTATIYPSMIYLSKELNIARKRFSRLLFKGKIINQLFPPAQKIKYDSSKDFNKVQDGSKIIELKSFEETDVQFTSQILGEDVECIFGVYVPGSIKYDDNNLGELTSYFEISFKKPKHIKYIPSVYESVLKFFQFLIKQKDISFEEVEVSLWTNRGFDKIGNFYDIVNNTAESNDIRISYTINNLLSNIGQLFSKVCENDLNYNYLAKDNYESKYVTPESYIRVCGAFEHNYKKIFKNPEHKDKFKLETITYIEDLFNEKIKQESLNTKYQHYYQHIINVLKNDINSLEVQYNRCLGYYKQNINKFINKVLSWFNIDKEKNFGKIFSELRNVDAHGEFVIFTNESVCAFVIGLVLIECMILEDAGYTKNEIGIIINSRY